MPRQRTITRVAFRAIAPICGASLLVYLIGRIGPANLFRSIADLGWGLVLIIALGGVAQLVRAAAWRLTLADFSSSVSFPRLVQLRLASEAVGQFGALGLIFGEGLRVTALNRTIPVDSRISSVTLDRAMFIVSSAMVSLGGIVAALLAVTFTRELRWYALLFALTLFGLLVLVVLAISNRWPLVSRSARSFSKLRFLRGRIEAILPVIHSVEKNVYGFHRRAPKTFWASLSLNFLCQGMAVFEVYLILWLMGVRIGFLGALIFEALTKLVNALGAINPGNVGTYEGGNLLIAKLLGLSSTVGLSVAMSRRLRAFFWTSVGGLCLLFLSRSDIRGDANEKRSGTNPRKPTFLMSSQGEHKRFTSVIFANAFHKDGEVESTLLKVGALPILLRVILSVRKAFGDRIVVCIDPLTRRTLEDAMLGTGRLPDSVAWVEASSEAALPQVLEQIGYISGNDGQVMLVAGDRTYHPMLFGKARDWKGSDEAFSLASDGCPVGICVLRSDYLFSAAERCSGCVCEIDQLHRWLKENRSLECESIDDGLWQRVVTEEDRVIAERKLDHWLVKPTDGIFAQMNRRISVPISRKLIRFPITPNMVSIFTLGVGIVSAAFFALGGYWSMLLGAVLSVWASILDGCDGEVARLKLLDSEFGCWLETICDYLYYLLIFSGMTIGLTRSTGNRTYVFWGALLLFGAVTSFLVAGLGRHRLAAGRPEQYLGIWQRKAENQRSNPILYIGRHTEFIIRRCFFPYALLFFAILNLTEVAFLLTSIGANLVWIVSLYSHCAFTLVRESNITDSPVSAESSAAQG
jgi:phosphatidylglycerophosphate synthase/uncharacterized membrane protein YbhN (UPF0104 family)